MASGSEEGGVDVLGPFRQLTSLRRDVLVLSLAMFTFSLAFQMTSRYIPQYIEALGGAAFVGLYLSLGNLIGAVYPYVGGAVSDRIGSRHALTLFGTVTTVGFLVWAAAPVLGPVLGAGAWVWIFPGLLLTQAWKSLGLGATFAVVKQSTDPEHLALGFASTEVFRRVGFLLGPLLATGVLAVTAFVAGFQVVLLLAVAFGLGGTIAQHRLYDAAADTVGDTFDGVGEVLADLRTLPATLRPLLVADTLVRFANGMVYGFFVIWVVDRGVGASVLGVTLGPEAYFGILLAVEMVVALVSMPPMAKLAEYTGLKPVVAVGFAVYAVFPAVLVVAPDTPILYLLLFAFSGLRFAGLPAHKALIVGPAEADSGGRVTGTYYLVRNAVVIPSGVIGGLVYYGEWQATVGGLEIGAGPETAFLLASAVGVLGVVYFLLFGREFEAYAA